jgi:hypothetical protein
VVTLAPLEEGQLTSEERAELARLRKENRILLERPWQTV